MTEGNESTLPVCIGTGGVAEARRVDGGGAGGAGYSDSVACHSVDIRLAMKRKKKNREDTYQMATAAQWDRQGMHGRVWRWRRRWWRWQSTRGQ